MLDCEFEAEGLGVVVLDVEETFVDLWIELFEELEGDFEVCYCYEHADIEGATVGNSLFEGYS